MLAVNEVGAVGTVPGVLVVDAEAPPPASLTART